MEVCQHVLLQGEHDYDLIEARAYLAAQPPEVLHQLRFRMAGSGGRPTAMCPYCQEPLRLAGGQQETGGPRSPTLHFRHRVNPAVLCIQKSDAQYTPDEIRAIKYCGQRESELHRWTKTALAEALQFTPGIEPDSIRIEKRFPAMDRKAWRQPDVRARWHDHDLVFEAQLDTTHISVLAERDAFYREQQSRLVWVFAVAPDRRLRFVEKDVLYNYRGNLFVFNRDCLARSQAANRIMLEAWWIDPAWLALHHAERPDEIPWHTSYVSLTDLQFPADGAPPFFVDTLQAPSTTQDDDRGVEMEEPWEAELRERIEVAVLGHPPPARLRSLPFPDRRPPQFQRKARSALRAAVVEAVQCLDPSAPSAHLEIWAFCKFAKAMFALEHGRPVHTNLTHLIQVENLVFGTNRAFYRPFCYALRHLDRVGPKRLLSPKHRETHTQHKLEFGRCMKTGDERYKQNRQFDRLIHVLWPWIDEEEHEPTHRDRFARLVPGDILTGDINSS